MSIENNKLYMKNLIFSRYAIHVAIICLMICGCSAPVRNALPEKLVHSAHIPGIDNAYTWGDQEPLDLDLQQSEALEVINRLVSEKGEDWLKEPLNYLALSGGGPNGAYGAGILKGWSKAGTRPKFNVVTGVSTGAIIAPFAFLGSDYDKVLLEIYTQYRTKDAVRFRSLLGLLLGDSAADASGMRALIRKYIDAEVMQSVAKEYSNGRSLFIGTTNLDSGRPVSWDIGRIAASGAPHALSLIQDIILASASIPGVFPPVMIEYEANGLRYHEMHVDGGVTRQVFLFPGELRFQQLLQDLGLTGKQQLYIIYNGSPAHKREIVKQDIFAISTRSIRTLIKSQGVGDLYRMFLFAQKNDIAFSLTSIPPNFIEQSEEMFDRDYMQRLLDIGFQKGQQPDFWQHNPPEFQATDPVKGN
jgi:hypothetical protein